MNTTSDGCAFFAYLTPGSYSVTLNKLTYVDGQGATGPSQTATVVAATTASIQFQYDEASTLVLTLAGQSGGAVPSVPVSVGNSHLLPVGIKTFAGAGASRSVTGLFPYADGYQVWAGNCADADPQGHKSDGTAYYPGAVRDNAIAVTPAGSSTGTVQMDTLTVTVKKAGVAQSALTVLAVHAADAGCGSGTTITLGTTDATGTVIAAMPYGSWTIQVSGKSPSGAWPVAALAPPASANTVAVTIL